MPRFYSRFDISVYGTFPIVINIKSELSNEIIISPHHIHGAVALIPLGWEALLWGIGALLSKTAEQVNSQKKKGRIR